jgi:hypothetical protein
MESLKMKINQWTTIVSIFFLGLLIFTHCTDNPFDEGDISGGKREVRGKVVLSEPGGLQDVFVWLEGFNIGTRTDEQGNFKLTLPPSSGQNSGGGLDGLFNLYFYLANYKLDTSQVLIRDGEFIYSRADINKNGELKEAKSLTQFLRIKTEVAPSKVFVNSTELLGIKVTLEAVLVDSVTVVFPGVVGGFLGAALLRNLETDVVFFVESTAGATTRDAVVVGPIPASRSLLFTLINDPLPKGKYEVIPYLLVKHEEIPSQLMESLGNEVEDLSPNYLKIPFKRETPILEIK